MWGDVEVLDAGAIGQRQAQGRLLSAGLATAFEYVCDGARTESALDESLLPAQAPACDVLGVDAALDALTAIDPRRGKVVELRIFGGLSVEETATALGVSTDTVSRDWKLAKAWLARELANSSEARDV